MAVREAVGGGENGSRRERGCCGCGGRTVDLAGVSREERFHGSMFERRGRLGLEDSCVNEDVKTFRKTGLAERVLLSDVDPESVTTSFLVILCNTPASS